MKMIKDFFHKETSVGILLIISTIIALILANTPLKTFYTKFLDIPLGVVFGGLEIQKPLILWVNDGLMAIFFFLVGLEIKREVLEGALSSVSKITLPAIAALGGMIMPAVIYTLINYGDPIAMKGWAIPTATDIAFALGVLALLGNRVHPALKIFLMALAIIDDLGAIIIIALFYTKGLSLVSLAVAAAAIFGLLILNLLNVSKKMPYILLGIILWVSVLKSGVHATLAGVVLAKFIPIKEINGKSMLKELEHELHSFVNFFVLPLFAFVNAGIDLRDLSLNKLFSGAPLGIMLGLFLGKQIGVFGFSWIAMKLKIAKMPDGVNLKMFYGVSVLTGIGFTMSLFIDSLAFGDATLFKFADKLAILLGSLISGIVGYLILRKT
ncbi:Na+/H+ antiporter NhaA [Caminibacter pacificus]|uniref:Na(+)/H(+) antiporter NhaA n=1 Tax=Caminibacter pacificus TaxID=1424653 RepID=A0AAJ4UYE5_9BACT|nr:Na+/H+ antiporter NhaA [Caminibacter pacificus]QCI28555.1 Na+/H+ antiporter NhaA [Caminibacter pacificus]ROR40718.1 sodium/proton antiporter (NhaA family) [Caminibacter pacificus]